MSMTIYSHEELKDAVLSILEGEGRRSQPDVAYQEDRYKSGQSKGKIKQVIAVLSGKESERFSKLIKTYEELKLNQEKLEEAMVDLRDSKIKPYCESLFSAEDELETCVIQACTTTAKLSSTTPDAEVTTSTTDYKKVVEALEALVPELSAKIKELIQEATVTETKIKKGSIRKLTSIETPNTAKLKESVVTEGVLDSIIAKTKSFLNRIVSWKKSYLEDLRRINVLIGRI